MISAIAIDDEPPALEIIRSHASQIPFLQLEATFSNPFDALEFLEKRAVDLVFLDIQMPDINGIDFLKTIRNRKFAVVLTTAYSEYAVVGFQVAASDYLLKPFDLPRFLQAVNQVRDRIAPRKRYEDFFFVDSGNQKVKLCFDEISHIESNGNYVAYHLENEKVLARSSMKETLQYLPGYFVQVNRSFIVSLHKLERVQDNHVIIGKIQNPDRAGLQRRIS